MPKIPKQTLKEVKYREKYKADEKFAYRSTIISVIFGGIFLTVSLILNTEFITLFLNQNIIWNIVDVSIKTVVILLFFLFMITSIGNYKELIGKPLNWKELLLLIFLSIGQTLLNPWVFISTFLGLILIIIYLFIVQEI